MTFLIAYEPQLLVAGPNWNGFNRLRDDASGCMDCRLAFWCGLPTAAGHRICARAELRT